MPKRSLNAHNQSERIGRHCGLESRPEPSPVPAHPHEILRVGFIKLMKPATWKEGHQVQSSLTGSWQIFDACERGYAVSMLTSSLSHTPRRNPAYLLKVFIFIATVLAVPWLGVFPHRLLPLSSLGSSFGGHVIGM